MNTHLEDEVRTHLLGDALRQRWLMVVATALVVVGAVAFVVLRSTPQYVSTASVFLQPIAGNALSPDATISGQQVTVAMATEAGLVDSPAVVSLVSHDLGVPQDKLLSNVTATVPSNTKIVSIRFSAATPKAARLGAQTFAESFLTFRQQLASAAQDRQMAKLRTQVKAASASLDQLSLRAGTSASARRQILISQLAGLQSSIGQLDATDVHPGSVSSVANLPKKASGINPLLILFAAGLFGLGLGFVGAIAREVTDDKIRRASFGSISGLPVLSEIRARRRRELPLLLSSGDDLELDDAFRRLRVGVLATVPKAKSISVCPSSSGHDVLAHVANLALVMSRAGLRVVLVDATGADGLGRVFGDLLSGDPTSPGGSPVTTSGEQSLRALSVTDPGETEIEERRLGRIVAHHRKTADYVLIAGKALLTADGEVAAMASDSVLLMVGQGNTRRRDVALLVEHSRILGLEIFGLLSVPMPRHAKSRRGKASSLAHPAKGASHRGLRSLGNRLRAVFVRRGASGSGARRPVRAVTAATEET